MRGLHNGKYLKLCSNLFSNMADISMIHKNFCGSNQTSIDTQFLVFQFIFDQIKRDICFIRSKMLHVPYVHAASSNDTFSPYLFI